MPQDIIRKALMKIDKSYLPYQYFERLINFKEVEVFDGVTVKRLPSVQGVYMITKLSADTKIIEHYHNAKEFFHITKGKLILNGKIELGVGDEFVFQPFELHKVNVIEDCEMYVQLMKDENIKKFN